MIDISKSRVIKLYCEFCKKDQIIYVPFGANLHVDKGLEVEILEERPARKDRPLQDVVCLECGCCSGLVIKN